MLRRPGRITVEMALAPEDGYDVIPSLWVDDYSAMTPVDEEGTPLTSDASDGDEDRGLA